jgi:hypothetical protein
MPIFSLFPLIIIVVFSAKRKGAYTVSPWLCEYTSRHGLPEGQEMMMMHMNISDHGAKLSPGNISAKKWRGSPVENAFLA